MGGGLYEVRTDLLRNRIARVLFYVDARHRIVLLHGFIKKTRRHRPKIWTWPEPTRASMKEALHEI
jgi:phage-related protein